MNLCYKWHKENGRYYQIYLLKDFFDTWMLTCSWGSLYSRLGNYKNFAFQSYEEALQMIEDVKKKRNKRGYNLIL